MFIEKVTHSLNYPQQVIFPEAANAAILKHDKWADVWETLTTDADLNYTDEKDCESFFSGHVSHICYLSGYYGRMDECAWIQWR